MGSLVDKIPFHDIKWNMIVIALYSSISVMILLVEDGIKHASNQDDDWTLSMKNHRIFESRIMTHNATKSIESAKTAYESAMHMIMLAAVFSYLATTIAIPIVRWGCSWVASKSANKGCVKKIFTHMGNVLSFTDTDTKNGGFNQTILMCLSAWTEVRLKQCIIGVTCVFAILAPSIEYSSNVNNFCVTWDKCDSGVIENDTLYTFSLWVGYGWFWLILFVFCDLLSAVGSYVLYKSEEVNKELTVAAVDDKRYCSMRGPNTAQAQTMFWCFTAQLFFAALQPDNTFSGHSDRYCNVGGVPGVGYYLNGTTVPYPNSQHIVSDVSLIAFMVSWNLIIFSLAFIVVTLVSYFQNRESISSLFYVYKKLENPIAHFVWHDVCGYALACNPFFWVWLILFIASVVWTRDSHKNGYLLWDCVDVSGSNIDALFYGGNFCVLMALMLYGGGSRYRTNGDAFHNSAAPPLSMGDDKEDDDPRDEELTMYAAVPTSSNNEFQLHFKPAPLQGPSVKCPLKRGGEDALYSNSI